MTKSLFLFAAVTLGLLLGASLRSKAYVLEGQQWANGTIVMNLQLSSAIVPYPAGGLQDGSASWNAVAEAALAEWNQYLLHVQFTFNTNTLTPASPDNINSVFFSSTCFGQSFGSGTLGITVRYFNQTTNLTAESDTVINTAFQWDSYRGNLQPNAQDSAYIFDLRRVLDHELGHNLGLNHPDLATPPQTVVAIMNSVTSDLDHIELDDIEGVWSMYGQKTVLEPITVLASPSNAGTVTGNGNFQLGSTQTITAAAATGFAFTQWEDGSSSGSTNASRTITVGVGGATYTADFAPALTVWTNELPSTAEGLQGIQFVNGGFIAFGVFGIDTSPDGVTWTVHQATGASHFSTAVAYHGGTFVTVGSSGQVSTSTNGIAWTSHNTAFTSANFSSVTYGNGLFVAVGQSSDSSAPTPVMTSPDGVTWTLRTQVISGFSLLSVAYANGTFVAVGQEGNTGVAMTSPDGVNWAVQFINAVEGLTNLAYGHGVFEASTINGGVLYSSTDGLNWTQAASLGAYPFSIAYGNGMFLAEAFDVGGSSNIDSDVASSSDGLSWQRVTTVVPIVNAQAIAFGAGRFVAVGNNGIFTTGALPAVTAAVLPVISSSTSAIALTTTAFSYGIAASNAPFVFNATGLPAGLSIDLPSGTISGTPSVTGTFPVTLFATNDAGSGTATLHLTVNAGVSATPQSFSNWATANNVTGSMSDTPRKDGIPNLLKYVFDIDPTVPLTATARASLPVFATASSGTQLTLTFPENKILENVGVTVESSTDMASWSTPSGASITPTGNVNSNGDVIMIAQVPVTANIQFIRLVVTPQ